MELEKENSKQDKDPFISMLDTQKISKLFEYQFS